ncbi:MAG: 2-oxoglutarate dehydrogenase E1 component, partial [Rhodothermales bacterium]
QMFHMLRRQILRTVRKPLIVMTPKSLLRNKASTSELRLLEEGEYQLVIDDRKVENREAVKRIVMCSGKVWYDLDETRSETNNSLVTLIRIEQLHPFPEQQLAEVIARYPNAFDVVWCQEEPQNQGAWYQIRHHLQSCLKKNHVLVYVGRESSASPAVGKYAVHVHQQQKLVEQALSIGLGDDRQ